jgi:hypothetical protein
MTTIKIKENQSVLDVACQTIGTLEGAFIFALINGLSITDDINSNDVYLIPETASKKNEISTYFLTKKVELATGFPRVEIASYGVGEMIIENNFIVR